jgi:hypothetical protein
MMDQKTKTNNLPMALNGSGVGLLAVGSLLYILDITMLAVIFMFLAGICLGVAGALIFGHPDKTRMDDLMAQNARLRMLLDRALRTSKKEDRRRDKLEVGD